MSDHAVSIPSWLAKVISITCGLVVLIATAAIPWASNVASNISEIKTQVAGNSHLTAVEMGYLRDRMANGESQQKDLEGRVRELEHLIGTKRTASRPLSVD